MTSTDAHPGMSISGEMRRTIDAELSGIERDEDVRIIFATDNIMDNFAIDWPTN